MTTIEHTPGPWQQHWQFIVAPDPDGIHPDIYIAEIAEEDSEGRIASPEQQKANGQVIVAAPALLAALRTLAQQADEDCPAEYRTRHFTDAIEQAHTAIFLATDTRSPSGIMDDRPAGSCPYSVLLLYPVYDNDNGTETYYALVKAAGPDEATELAQRQAAASLDGIEVEPDDFVPLLVTKGHHASESLFNK
jgi:hypothetical protein